MASKLPKRSEAPPSEGVAQDVLRSFFERWQRLEEEKRAIGDDLKELFAEAKGGGFDPKVMRRVFRDKTGDASERAEFEALYELYASALGMQVANARDAHEAKPVLRDGAVVARLAHNQEVVGANPAPATSVEAHEEGAADGESPSPEAVGDTAPNAGGNHAEVTSSSIDPETASQSDGMGRVIDEHVGAIPADGPRAGVGPSASDVEPVAPIRTAPPGTFLNSKGLPRRIGCQQPEVCASTWRALCNGCKPEAAAQSQVAA